MKLLLSKDVRTVFLKSPSHIKFINIFLTTKENKIKIIIYDLDLKDLNIQSLYFLYNTK